MVEDLNEVIISEILEKENYKLKEETIEEYLLSFKKDALIRLALTHVFVTRDSKELYKVSGLKSKTKAIIVDYIITNLNEILICYLKIFNEDVLNWLKKIASSKENIILLEEADANLNIIMLIKNFALAKIEYNKKTKEVKAYMPKEFKKAIKKALDSKEVIESNERFNKVCDYVEKNLEIYGIIDIIKLHEIIEFQLGNIDCDEFEHILLCKSIVDETINIINNNSSILVGNIEFCDVDYASEFYNSLRGKYKVYSKAELEKITSDNYIESLSSYKKFINILMVIYDIFDEEELTMIKELIIKDYIEMAQTDKNVAKVGFESKMYDMFEIDDTEVRNLLKLLEDMYKEIPKWKKLGNK